MQIVPVINCSDFEEAKKRILIADKFLAPGERNLHLDITDGIFTPYKTWNDPSLLQSFIQKEKLNFSLAIHLMVSDPLAHLTLWSLINIQKAIIPFDAIVNHQLIIKYCFNHHIIPVLSISPYLDLDGLFKNNFGYRYFQVLGVEAGPPGQKIKEETFSQIKNLKKKMPSAIIEVDGGINLETIKLIRDSGADIAVSGSYIFDSNSPSKNYLALKKAIQT